MPKDHNSFQDLVAKAPPAPSDAPVSLVGTLAKSKDDGKFVLILADGGSVTMNISDVKSHTVLGNSLGLNLVQVEVEADVARNLNFGGVQLGPQKIPAGDIHKSPIIDSLSTLWTDLKLQHTDPIYDYRFGPGATEPEQVQGGSVSPFALATPQQAPAHVLAAFHQAALPKVTADRTGSIQDYTGVTFDAHITGIGDFHKVQADPI
jgi:hypothetical protein